jgi:uncharacterized protein
MQPDLFEGVEAYNQRDYTKAYEVFIHLATYYRNAEAQYYLGMMYRDGDGVESNLDTAITWWKKATREGHQDAAYAMSEFKTSTKTMF